MISKKMEYVALGQGQMDPGLVACLKDENVHPSVESPMVPDTASCETLALSECLLL